MDKELPIPKCFDNPADAAERLTEMFVEIGQARDTRLNPPPAQRGVPAAASLASRTGGSSGATTCPRRGALGIFAHERLDAWMRVRRHRADRSRPPRQHCGIGLKLFGVRGERAGRDRRDRRPDHAEHRPLLPRYPAKTMVRSSPTPRSSSAATTRILAGHPDINAVLTEMSAPRGPAA